MKQAFLNVANLVAIWTPARLTNRWPILLSAARKQHVLSLRATQYARSYRSSVIRRRSRKCCLPVAPASPDKLWAVTRISRSRDNFAPKMFSSASDSGLTLKSIRSHRGWVPSMPTKRRYSWRATNRVVTIKIRGLKKKKRGGKFRACCIRPIRVWLPNPSTATSQRVYLASWEFNFRDHRRPQDWPTPVTNKTRGWK